MMPQLSGIELNIARQNSLYQQKHIPARSWLPKLLQFKSRTMGMKLTAVELCTKVSYHFSCTDNAKAVDGGSKLSPHPQLKHFV